MDSKEAISKLVQASTVLAALGEESSFTKAAERLNVDQSAISHRIKALEEALGHTLFDRTTRQMRITEIGEILVNAAMDNIRSWDVALEKVERSQTTNMIRLSLSSSLAMKWLIPALPNSKLNHLNVSVEVREETVDFLSDEAHAAIRFGPGPYPGLHTTHLSHCWLQPVASSNYLSNRPSEKPLLTDPKTIFLADRRGETDKTDASWKYYFTHTGLAKEIFNADYQFDRTDLMLQAVIGGIGVGLGRTLLVEPDLAAGYFQSVGSPIQMRSSYWLVCSAAFAETNRFEKLRDWLVSEVSKTRRTINE